MNPPDGPPAAALTYLARAILEEDRAFEDVSTAAAVPAGLRGTGLLVAKSVGVIAGLPAAAAIFAAAGRGLEFRREVQDGARAEAGTVIATVTGPVQLILQAERSALNVLQRLSGVATATAAYVERIRGTGAVILDTRKTTPLLRDLEKYAVRCGGGTNHRRDLASMVMLKDNHLAALARGGGSIAETVATARRSTDGIRVEVEIDSLGQLPEALAAAPDWILLDNMSPGDLHRAVELTAGKAKLEASGGITLTTVREVAETGVDAISVGALTHSAPALDIGLDLSF
ncbi:MAG: carboxylating nicotinate-nucleotide diphosphorylase [Dehalococcoidia bacterium]